MKGRTDPVLFEALYLQGLSDAQIAEKAGCCAATVAVWRRANGRQGNALERKRVIPQILEDELLQKLREGQPLAVVSSDYELPLEVLRKFAHRHGVTPVAPAYRSRCPERMGGILDRAGYVLLRVRIDGPYGNLVRPSTVKGEYGYAPLHRMRMQDKLGRPLLASEVVHHKDGDVYNNSPGNLEVYQSNGEHLKETLKGAVPAWSPEGFAAMCAPRPGYQRASPHNKPRKSPSKTDASE